MSSRKGLASIPRRATAHATRHRSAAPRIIRLGAREVLTQGIPREILLDLYHYFMTVSWIRLFATILAFFLVFDLLFGCLFHLVPGCIANLNPPGFLGDFFFSVETLATVGYGDMHPQTLYGHVVAMLEIFVGLMMLAIITGIMFARFSKPRARFLFARSAVVRPIDGKLTLMFRTANARQNVVQEASADLRMLRDEVSQEGFSIRRIVDLPLVRSRHPVFALSWTIMHIIDETSPLANERAVARGGRCDLLADPRRNGRDHGSIPHGARGVPKPLDPLERGVPRHPAIDRRWYAAHRLR
jgi:inward rectifier potassium channel